MRAVILLVLGAYFFAPAPPTAQKRISSQYVPSGFGGRAVFPQTVELALDVAGGRDKCYLYGPPDATNWNHLWSIRPAGDAVMLVSHVDEMALDANAGSGNPYPRKADASNVNHLWILTKVGEDYMIWPKVKNVVLDANGGRGRPYLSSNPDPRNINQLWSLRKVGNWNMIVSKVRRQTTNVIDVLPRGPAIPTLGGSAIWQVGQPMPEIQALAPDGNPLDMKQLHGKTVVMSFWSMNDLDAQKHFDLLQEIRKEFITVKPLQMINVCLNAEWSGWMEFLEKQKPYDENFPDRPLYSDTRCWQMFHANGESHLNPVARTTPQSLVIGADGKLMSVNVPDEKLRDVVKNAVELTRAK